MQRKLDPRVVRTRHMLHEALIALIGEKGYDDITIQDITDRAGLRRATFYLHYTDKEKLLFAILGETFDALVVEIDKIKGQLAMSSIEYATYLTIFKHVEQNVSLYKSILSGHGATTITRYIREYLAKKFLEMLPDCNPGGQELMMPADVLANFGATVKLSMATWWLEQGMPYSPEYMADLCTKLQQYGIQAAFNPAELVTMSK